jgi:glutamate-1-semialdehyde 2,1-aminomutase
MEEGCNAGIPFPHEVEAARLITQLVPSAEKVKFTNSGMDASMLGVRAARVYTGRSDIGVFEGHFHGWEDQLVTGYSQAKGIPPGVQENIVVFPFNDIAAVAAEIPRHNFAAIILEPFSTNAGAIPTDVNFLQELRRLCTENGIVLIYDEVVTNFRFAVGGAQEYYGVLPDLTALGKPMAGGFTVIGALAGKAEIMDVMDHNRRADYVYHGVWMAPVVMAAVKAALTLIRDGELIRQANARGDRLRSGLDEIFERAGIPAQNVGIGSAVRTHLTDQPIRTLVDVRRADKAKLARFHLGLVNRGHFVLPGRNAYVSFVTSDAEIAQHLDDAEMVVKRMQS